MVEHHLSNASLTDPDLGMWVPRVINGWPAKKGDVPYQVALKSLSNKRRKEYKTFCGATIVQPTKLISAAHCFSERLRSNSHKLMYPGTASVDILKDKYAVAGNLYNKASLRPDGEDGQWRTIRKCVYPRNYRFPHNDISIVFLYDPFIYTNNIGPIPVATRNADYHGKCLVSGYGRIGRGDKDFSEVLLLAHLDIVPKLQCSRVHRRRMDKFVCTSSRLTDVGKGDSGGPLVCANTGDPNERDEGEGVLVGVVSGHSRGRGSFFTRDLAEALLLGHLHLRTKGKCDRVFHKKMPNFICTSSRLTDIGKGDSGGPLVCKNTGDPNEKEEGVLVGVVSAHIRGRGSIFIRVSEYQDFLGEISAKSFSEEATEYQDFLGEISSKSFSEEANTPKCEGFNIACLTETETLISDVILQFANEHRRVGPFKLRFFLKRKERTGEANTLSRIF